MPSHTRPSASKTVSGPASGAASEKSGYYLCLNAAEGRLQMLIARREEADPDLFTLLCCQNWHAPSQGAELLIPALTDALQRLGLAARDMRNIACTRGPGSFTGLRLTLATAAGLSRSTGARQAGIDYLPLLAHSACRRLGQLLCDPMAAEQGEDREKTRIPVWTLTHARKNLVHLQGFEVPVPARASGGMCPFSFSPLTAIHVCTPQEAALFINEYRAADKGGVRIRPLVLGSGLSRNYAAFAAALSAGTASETLAPNELRPALLPPDFDHPLPEALLDAAASLAYFPKDIEPLYSRPADAEENLERIALSLGLDPAKARQKLDRLTRELHISS